MEEELIKGTVNIVQVKQKVDSLRILYDSLNTGNHKFFGYIIDYFRNLKEQLEKVYVIHKGDYLWKISKDLLDDPYKWSQIYEYNKDSLSRPDLIYPNQKIIIPVKDTIIVNSPLHAFIDSIKTSEVITATIDSSKEVKSSYDDIEITQFIVDETQTKLGKDFFDIFYKTWTDINQDFNYSIVISEMPLPQLGTQVSLSVNDNLIFQQRLSPKYELIEEIAQYAVQAVFSYINNYEEIQKDLSGEDLQGTGIY